MKKNSKKTRKPDCVTDCSTASGAAVHINVYKADQVCVNNFPRKPDDDGKKTVNEDDFLVSLVAEVLGQREGKTEALHTLEQGICDRIRHRKRAQFSSFQELTGSSFRAFVERNSQHFALENDGQYYNVSLKKKRKKKKKDRGSKRCEEEPQGARQSDFQDTSVKDLPVDLHCEEHQLNLSDDTDEENSLNDRNPQWVKVRSKKGRAQQPEVSRLRKYSPAEVNSGECSTQLFNLSPDTLLIRNLMKQSPGNTLVFQLNDEVYKRDRIQFIKDVTSLWNTPDRGVAYIIMGIQVQCQPPHRVEGLQTSTDESVYQSMFSKYLFSSIPAFRYREVEYCSARIGMVEVYSRHASCSPSIVTNNDLAASGLREGLLLLRKDGINLSVSPGNSLYQKICGWDESIKTPYTSKCSGAMISKSYSQILQNQKTLKTSISEENSGSAMASQATPSKVKQLMQALNNFQKVHFMLIIGSQRTVCSNIEALAAAPWVAVFDFDFQGRDTGLLSILEDSIRRRRSLSVLTWCDSCKGITEKGTQWWSLRGRREIAESHIAEDVQVWCRRVKDKLEKICLEIARFAEDYTVLSVLVLWPDSEQEAKCIYRFLCKLQEHIDFKIILCFPDNAKDYTQSEAAGHVLWDFGDSVEKFKVNLESFCSEVELLTQSNGPSEKLQYQLPSADSSVVVLEEKDVAWLSQDLEVLYLQRPHSKELTDQDLNDEAENFFRGGTIDWNIFYETKYKYFDVERVMAKKVISYIQKEFIVESRNGMVKIYHAPGAGGSTMTRRVLWNLHLQVPCVHVKQRTGSSMEEISAQLTFLYDKCRMPIIALMDGEDESRIKQLSRQLQRHHIVILHVKRYPYEEFAASNGRFYLPGAVIAKESSMLLVKYRKQCDDDKKKIDALVKLDSDVQEELEMHQMFEYGMTVYQHEFQGVRAYVRGHLQLEEDRQREFQPWQKCLGFLALVYYYGQSSLPCQFFVSLLGKQSNYKMDLDDFPYQVRVFVVRDNNEGKDHCMRIGHFIIAKEILEQMLNKGSRIPSGKCKSTSDKLSAEARRNLKEFSLEFISQAKRKGKTSLSSQTILQILTKTFIFRDNDEVSDMGDAQGFESQTKRKSQFSQIMNHIDSDPPYHGRLEVLQKLCDTFPDDPNFRAHLGRFYTCCRPEAEQEAEKHFKEALRLCNERSANKEGHDIDDKSKLTLMHIYHMYGMFFQVRIDRLTKSCSSSPRHDPEFGDILAEIVNNANCACENFINSRNATPPGQEESYIYTNEIHVRLRTCEFVQSRFKKLRNCLIGAGSECDTARAFVVESVTEIDSLIMECFDTQVDVHLLQKYVSWFYRLFHSCTSDLQHLFRADRLASLRLSITVAKLKVRGEEDIIWADKYIPEIEIEKIVQLHEDVLQEVSNFRAEGKMKMKSKLELDFKDWILAIRHPQFKKVYELEKVLERVRHWHELCRSPQSAYYLFVLLSLLGLVCIRLRSRNTECLVEAQMMLEQLRKLSKMELKSRFPREWLGRRDIAGIKCLITHSNVSYEDRCIKNSSRAKLAVCKGTICPRFQKAAGYIDLDLGVNSTSVKVFFIPARADLVESRDAGARVQFHMAFTLDKGYEAYEVNLLNRYRCLHCPQRIEMTRDQVEVQCPKCKAMVIRSEHSQDSLPAENTEGS